VLKYSKMFIFYEKEITINIITWIVQELKKLSPQAKILQVISSLEKEKNQIDAKKRAEQGINDYFAWGTADASVGELKVEDLVDDICEERNTPDAFNLACAWIKKDAKELINIMDIVDINLIVAAVVAVVIALVLLARRSSPVKAHRTEFHVSKDFAALQIIRDQGGDAADLASKLIKQEQKPWGFRLESAVEQLINNTDKRLLLSALECLDINVKKISPKRGDVFVKEEMSGELVVENGSTWIVAEQVPKEKIGFRRYDKVMVKADVDACTADWFCLTMVDDECPVAETVMSDTERYVGLEARYAPSWTINQGFSTFADLRSKFDEGTLVKWKSELRGRLLQWYTVDSERIPENIGEEGDRYDASVMRSVDEAPEADARVVAVEERDGHHQVGFGCKNAPPLLYAIVRVEEE
jgi:hypothetical protein